MAQRARTGRLHPAVGQARRALAESLAAHLPEAAPAPTGRARRAAAATKDQGGPRPLVLVACSGGPDSLALAAVLAHFGRRGDLRAGAVVVDHGLQAGSAETAEDAARTCRELGLDPVRVVPAAVERGPHGPEMAARLARYAALEAVAAQTGAAAVLLGHTLDDQAETVLLGLARGSGTRSLAGMPPERQLGPTLLLRPFLGLEREQIEQVCAAEALTPWQDPTNQDPGYRRNAVRHRVLPFLEEQLGPGIAQALARTAAVTGPDAELLEEMAARAHQEVRTDPAPYLRDAPALRDAPVDEATASAALSLTALREQPLALRRRVLARALVEAGGESPGFERLAALEELVAGHGNAGPVQMPGRVAVWRRRPAPGGSPGALILART